MSTQYLNPTTDEMWLNDRRGHCAWCGSEVTAQGCFCRYCDSCSECWKSDVRKDFSDGRPSKQTCPSCERDESVCNDIELALYEFETAWKNAPRDQSAYVEHDVAEYWFLKGQQSGRALQIVEENQNLRLMVKGRELR